MPQRGGAEIFCGGTTPKEFQYGCWLSPTIVGQVDLNSPLSQEENFGPVVVIHPVDDLGEAIEVNNSVKFGLVAALYSNDKSNRRRFAEAIETGILNFTQRPLVVHPASPLSEDGRPQDSVLPNMDYGTSSSTPRPKPFMPGVV